MRYSKPCKKLVQCGKFYAQLYREMGPVEARRQIAEEMIRERLSSGLSQDDAMHYTRLDMVIQKTVSLKSWTSLYIEENDLLDFLENSNLRESDKEVLFKATQRIESISGSTGIMIHLPKREHSIFCFVKTSPAGSRTVVISRGDYIGNTVLPDHGATLPTYTIDKSEERYTTWAIVLNLAMYMDAFPNTVRDGAPVLPSKASRPVDRKQSHIIGTSSVIKEVFRHSSVSPHMRRGHFRLLSDERYTHKQGQTVYVKPTMVKGKSKTVETIQ